MQMLYRLLEVFSGRVSEDVGICWADGRSSGAALTPEPLQMSQAPVAPSPWSVKSLIHRNRLVNTQQQLAPVLAA